MTNNGDFLVNAAIYGGGFIIQPTFITGEAMAEGKLQQILIGYDPHLWHFMRFMPTELF
ncbi:hypothetical protein [Psychromonas sp. MME2]|uniref:hypothetical protein n=1 Tax=Psychromonas sp. MME2 TaxID=3231033 RepID=UPI00339CA7A9